MGFPVEPSRRLRAPFGVGGFPFASKSVRIGRSIAA